VIDEHQVEAISDNEAVIWADIAAGVTLKALALRRSCGAQAQ
jgi:hypothetical protein